MEEKRETKPNLEVHAKKVYLSELCKDIIKKLDEENITLPEFLNAMKFASKSPYCLSPRQRQILILTATGLSIKEIAVKLGLGIKTVEAHRYQLYRKLDFHNITEVVRYAISHKLMEIKINENDIVDNDKTFLN